MKVLGLVAFFFVLVQATSVKAASEVSCFSDIWAVNIDKNDDEVLIGSLIIRNNLVQQIQFKKDPLNAPDYSKLKALFTGKTSQDSYELFIFKEKESSGHVSFLTSTSNLGHKKVIELRCKF